MSPSVVVVPRGHWFNSWFLRLSARPVVRVDGADHTAKWGQPTEIEVASGTHTVAVGARYRGAGVVVGLEESRIDVADDQQVLLEARNGFFNHQPFTVTNRALARG